MTSPETADPRGSVSAPTMRAEGYESFVVRVLVRRHDGRILNGKLTHVASGQHLHFTAPERLPDLIRRLLAVTDAEPFSPHADHA